MENVKLCTFNDKGFIYRLIEMDEDVPEWAAIDIYFNADLNDGLTQYIGMTSNPLKRSHAHRASKAGCATEAHFLECKAIWDYKQKNGEIPTLNKSGWGGA